MRLLISALNRLAIAQSILGIKLHRNAVIVRSAIQSTTLDASHVRHDFQLRIEARAAVGTEPGPRDQQSA